MARNSYSQNQYLLPQNYYGKYPKLQTLAFTLSKEAPTVQLVECRTLSPGARCCGLEQDTSLLLLSTGSTKENVPT